MWRGGKCGRGRRQHRCYRIKSIIDVVHNERSEVVSASNEAVAVSSSDDDEDNSSVAEAKPGKFAFNFY